MRKLIQLVVSSINLTLLGCVTPSQPTPSAVPASGLGATKASALEVCKPQGERAYLDRVRCADGSAPAYRRVGSFGGRTDLPANLTQEQEAALLERITSGAPLKPGEPDYHVIDGYELSCGAAKHIVYMDMYHCNQAPPTSAPTGFNLSKPS